jgi:hypothetical protein
MSFTRTSLPLSFCEHDGKPLRRLPERLYRHQRYPLEEKLRKKKMRKRTTVRMRRGKSWRLLNRTRRRRGGDFDRGNIHHAGRDSSVGIATRYGLNGPGIDSRLRA